MTGEGMTEDGKTPTDAPPEEDPRPDGLKPAKSLLLVNTGDGKGKSSAAFGVGIFLAEGLASAPRQLAEAGTWQHSELSPSSSC